MDADNWIGKHIRTTQCGYLDGHIGVVVRPSMDQSLTRCYVVRYSTFDLAPLRSSVMKNLDTLSDQETVVCSDWFSQDFRCLLMDLIGDAA